MSKRFGWLSILLAFGLAACTSPSPTLTAVAQPTARPVDLGAALVKTPAYPSLTYAIQAFVWWNPTTRGLDLTHVQQMHFTHVKQIFAWSAIQPIATAAYDWSHADAVVDEVAYRNLKLIARVDSAPDWALNAVNDPMPIKQNAWEAFCRELAGRYKGKIAGYQIWNEPNLAREWFGRTPDAGAYVRLLQSCFRQIKAVDPAAIIISAGLAPTGNNDALAIRDDLYLLQMYAAGAAAAYDVLGLNAPGYKSPPEADPGDPALQGQRWQVFRHVEDMRAIQVANQDGAKQIAILEMGWTLDKVHPEYAWFAVTEAEQARYLVNAYRYAAAHWRPWIGLMTTIYLPDNSWTEADEQYWWAISTPGYEPHMRQAYIDLANMEKTSGDSVTPARLAGAPVSTPLPSR